MAKYRIKTEEEFKRDGNWDYSRNAPKSWGLHGKMNKYLGQDIPDRYNEFCDNGLSFVYESWTFSPNNYTLKTVFIVGKWYKKQGFYGKLTAEICGNWFPSKEYIDSNKNYCTKGTGFYNWDNAQLVEDLSEIQEFLPDGHPDKIESKNFVLPEKWCIIGCEELANYQRITLKNEANCSLADSNLYYYNHTPNLDVKSWGFLTCLPFDYTEITFEQFKQHVLKQASVVETPKEENYVGRTIKALVNSPDGTGVEKGEQIKIIDIELGRYKLDITKAGDEEMVTEKPLSLSKWELVPEKQSIPEYVECIKSLSNQKIGDIEKTSEVPKWTSGWSKESFWEQYYPSHYKPSTKEAYEAQFVSKKLTKEDLVEGEIYIYDDTHISTYPEGPSFAIKEKFYEPNPKWLWTLSITHATEEQKDLLRSEIEKRGEKMEKKEWSVGTYAVGVKGNFGVFKGSDNLVEIGKIYEITKFFDSDDKIGVRESRYWVYKDNLKWFKTIDEALSFSVNLRFESDKIKNLNVGSDIVELESHNSVTLETKVNQPQLNKELIKPIYSIDVDLIVKNKKNRFIF